MKAYENINSPVDGGINSGDVTRFPDGSASANGAWELPAGLAMAFAQDTASLARFTALSNEEQDKVIEKARKVSTRGEMQSLVKSI